MTRPPLAATALLLALAACTPTPSRQAAPPPSTSIAGPVTVAAAAAPVAPRPYVKPSEEELRARLSPLAFEVTQRAATEPPFHNAFWDNHEPGLYVDVATGEPLFSSQDKFESGTGWPSFTRPVDGDHVVQHSDTTLGMVRTEVVSRVGGSHLGHVFDDGPEPTGMRYCINSAALRFVPVARLQAEGYGDYAARFGIGASSPPAPSTSNSCALPPPGERPGCSATLQTAIFARSAGADRLAKVPGVLSVTPGFEGTEQAVEVTFDPTKLTYGELLAAWTGQSDPGDGPPTAFVQGQEQRSVAQAAMAKEGRLRGVDAVPFRRE